MTDLAPGSRVVIVNPDIDITVSASQPVRVEDPEAVTVLHVNNPGAEVVISAPGLVQSLAKIEGPQGAPGLDGRVQNVVAGTNVTVNAADPANPVVSATVPVTSVNSKTGAVVLNNTDVGAAATSHSHAASGVTVTPTGGVAATDVQAALAELDTEKAAVGVSYTKSEADARFQPIATTDTWHVVGAAGEPAFQNGWTQGSPESLRYRLDIAGNVHIQGRVTIGTDDTVAFTLPTGYRPSQTLRFNSLGNSAFQLATIIIGTDGTVKPNLDGTGSTQINMNLPPFMTS